MTSTATHDQSLVYGMVGIPAEFDPHNQVLPNDFGIRVAFDSLLVPDESGGLMPRLAESWRPVESLVWEFRLRSGVRFASGRPLTAAAVKWNFDRVMSNPLLAVSPRINTLHKVVVRDALLVHFVTHVPDAIWPRRALQVVIADPMEAKEGSFGVNPGPDAGTGLFRICEFTPDRCVRLENAGHTWRGKAPIEALEMRPYDPPGLEQALLGGEAHFGYLTEEQVDRVAGSGLVLQRKLQANVHRIRIDCLKPPFDDRRLRRALSLAVDQRRIVEEAYLGRGWAPNQIVGEDCFGFIPAMPPLESDLQLARDLVDEVKYNGTLQFDVLEASAVIRPWCEHVLARLNEIGLPTEARYVDMRTYLGKMIRNSPARNELVGAGNQYGPGLDADFAIDKFSNQLVPENLEYSNPEYQAIYERSRSEFDPARRESLLQECTRILLADYACIPVLQPALSWLINSRIRGMNMNSLGAGWVDWRGVSLG